VLWERSLCKVGCVELSNTGLCPLCVSLSPGPQVSLRSPYVAVCTRYSQNVTLWHAVPSPASPGSCADFRTTSSLSWASAAPLKCWSQLQGSSCSYDSHLAHPNLSSRDWGCTIPDPPGNLGCLFPYFSCCFTLFCFATWLTVHLLERRPEHLWRGKW
jgi:hypothetical protein